MRLLVSVSEAAHMSHVLGEDRMASSDFRRIAGLWVSSESQVFRGLATVRIRPGRWITVAGVFLGVLSSSPSWWFSLESW